MFKRFLIMLAIVGLVLGGVFGFILFKGQMMRQFLTGQGEPVQTVATMTVDFEEWSPALKAIGNAKAVQGTGLSLELAGIVRAIHFKQGEFVRAGDLLLELDSGTDQAKLQALQASAELARITHRRDQAQFAAKAISQQVVDTSRANLDIAKAQVAEQQALIAKKQLRAPFAGKLGLRNADVGQYLAAGAVVSNLQDLSALYVDFWLPQQELGKLRVGQKLEVKVDAYPDQTFTAQVSAIDPKVDANSRNVLIRALMPNTDQRLLPGMYVTVALRTGGTQRQLTLPRTAITFNPYGATVFRVDQDGGDGQGQPKLIARQSFVKTGATRGDQVVVLDGVKEGDVIVIAGQIKLRNGSPVTIDNAVQPSNQANPEPLDE